MRGLGHQTRADRWARLALASPVAHPGTALEGPIPADGAAGILRAGAISVATGFAAATPSASVANAMQARNAIRDLIRIQDVVTRNSPPNGAMTSG